MSKAYHSGEIGQQIIQTNNQMTQQIELADAMMSGIMSYTNSPELVGEAYNSIRTRMSNVHGAIWRGVKACAQSIVQDNQTLVNQYNARVGDYYINGNIVLQSINSLMIVNQTLLIFPSNLYTDELIRQNNRMISYLEEKLNQLDSFDYETSSLFQNAKAYLRDIETGLNQIAGEGGWNASTMSFDSLSDESWMNEINNRYKDECLSKYLSSSGEITEEGFDYFEDMMKKDISQLSLEELDILSEIMMHANEQRDVEKLMALGYCIPIEIDGENHPTFEASETFKLTLLMSEKKLMDYVLSNYSNENFDWIDYHDRMTFNRLMISATSQIDYVVDLSSIVDDYKLFNLQKNLFEENGEYTLLFVQSLTDSSKFKTTMNANYIGFSEHAENEVIHGLYDKSELSDKFNYVLGLMTYIPISGQALGYALTLEETLNQLGISINDEKVLSSTGQTQKLEGKNGRDAAINATIADKLGLAVYEIDGKYYFGVSQETSEKISTYNSELDKLKMGINKEYFDDLEYEKVKDHFDDLGYTLVYDDNNGKYTIKGLENIDIKDIYNNPDKIEHIHEIKVAFSNMMTNQDKGIK